MQARNHVIVIRRVALALGLCASIAACGNTSSNKPSYEAPSGVKPTTSAEPAAPSDADLEAAAKKSINDANADAELEKLQKEIGDG